MKLDLPHKTILESILKRNLEFLRLNIALSSKCNLNSYELKRYLNYCSEMLAIIGKIAALYAQNFPDTTIISSVNEIESLTSGISRKAWQKIMILQQSKDAKLG